MNLHIVNQVVIEPAYTLLSAKMNKPEATALLLAIGLQESRFKYRVQLIGTSRHWWESLKGPARGGWQFERGGGVRGVLEHPSSRPHALEVLDALRYPAKASTIHQAIAHNDVLACCFARLLLWTDPRPLPDLMDPPELWWQYYLRNWRPGKPHRATWDDFWFQAVRTIHQLTQEA